MSLRKVSAQLFASVLLLFLIPSASATERLCDVSFEDCRAPLLQLIKNENQEIDAAFWFMDDVYIENALIAAKNRGVFVRMLVDPRSFEGHPSGTAALQCFAGLGPCPTPLPVPFPMRQPAVNGILANAILHWKMMLFSGQGTVEFSGANYSGRELIPSTPYVDYTDEAIYFSDDANVVNSFRRKYDDWWIDTVDYTDYANTSGLTLSRAYTMYPSIDPEMDFLPCRTGAASPTGPVPPCGISSTATVQNDYGTRSEGAINAEKVKLDIDMFRITNPVITNTAISAFTNRALPIRMIVDSSEYRNPARVWDSYNVDRLFMAGIPIKITNTNTNPNRQNHEKSMLLYGQAMTVFGSSNWTAPSFNAQQEHNYFPCSAQLAAYKSNVCSYQSPQKPWFFQWFQNQFERRWNSNTEYKAFVPLPPSTYGGSFIYKSPANGAASTATTVTLTWQGGPWAQQYDIYFGTAANPPLLASNVMNPNGPLTPETFKVSGLAPGTKYNWKIVSKTMANLSAVGQIWSFTTAASTPPTGATVSSITPTSGLSTGLTPVTITGTNFAAGATVSFGFATATNIVVVNSTTITAKTPPHVGGTTGVTVLNKAGDSGTLPNAFTFCLTITNGICSTTAVVPPPKLNLVSPATGSPMGGDPVVITGSNLRPGLGITFRDPVSGNTNTAGVNSVGQVSINATTPQNPAANPGAVDVIVTNTDGQNFILKGGFTYANPPNQPTVNSGGVSPASGSLNGGTNVTISGTGFNKGAIVTFGGSMATTIAVVNDTTILATTPPGAVGAADVVVTNIDPATGVIDNNCTCSSTLSGGYTYTSAPPPTINAVSPNTGTVNGGTQITITGSNFLFGATAFVGGKQATVQTTTGSYIYATTPAASNTGAADVTVVNPDGQNNTLSGGFNYQ